MSFVCSSIQTGGGAALSEALQVGSSTAARKSYDAGYEKGRSDAAKQQYQVLNERQRILPQSIDVPAAKPRRGFVFVGGDCCLTIQFTTMLALSKSTIRSFRTTDAASLTKHVGTGQPHACIFIGFGLLVQSLAANVSEIDVILQVTDGLIAGGQE